MREEVQRISKLVAEGKLSPEDAADLIDAFYASERIDEGEPVAGPYGTTESGPTEATPPPPPGASSDPAKDPFKTFVESIEKMTKEGFESVNWGEVSKHARSSARKGFDAFRSGVEDISKGKIHLGWLFTTETKEVSLPLSVPAGKTLRVENLSGEVKVVGGMESGEVTAKARFRGQSAEDARAKAEAYTLIIEESDHVVLIRQPDVSGLEVDLDIHLAGIAPIDIRCQSGEVKVANTGGGCRIVGRSGNITIKGVDGVTDVTTESGNVTIEDSVTSALSIECKSANILCARLKGNINARAASGNITLEAFAGKSIAVESVSGNLKIDLSEPVTGSVNARTVSGNVEIAALQASDCRVTLSTLRGDVECELELSDPSKQDQRMTGRLGSGAGTLDVSAVTGNVHLVAR